MINKKLNAGALQLTLFIIVVIALLLAAFVLIINGHHLYNIKTQFVKNTVEHSNNGIHYALRNNFEATTLQNKDFNYIKTEITKAYWGGFEKVRSTSTVKSNTFEKIALIGAKQPGFKRTVLYVEDNNKPLVLVGNTIIKGLAYLPKRGVKAGNIAGKSYYSSQLIYGQIRESSELPELNKKNFEHLKQLKNIDREAPQEAFLAINKERNHKNSFFKPTQFIVSNATINLSEISLVGNIIVKSKTKIIINSSAKLRDIVLVAPEIVVGNNVKGTFQAVASRQIKLNNNVTLNYPSALYVINEKPLEDKVDKNAAISIASNSKVSGSVVSITSNKTSNFKPQIVIDKNATVVGEVFCNQNLELLGEVKGTVFTANFLANQSGSIYQNHLYNAKINVNDLNPNYSGLLFKDSKKKVAKWLY